MLKPGGRPPTFSLISSAQKKKNHNGSMCGFTVSPRGSADLKKKKNHRRVLMLSSDSNSQNRKKKG